MDTAPPTIQDNTKQHVGPYNFSAVDILAYLFDQSELKGVSITEQRTQQQTISNSGKLDCTTCDDSGRQCTKDKHLETLRLLRSSTIHLSRAMSSFPSEVELCTSSVPGIGFGVRAVRTIPEGTWIGPYEGKPLKPDELAPDTDTSYMWEIFKDGTLAYYLDGKDEDSSSWMRFIQCARFKGEQNTSVMQYLGNIYYRVFKEIPMGHEILVWYDDTCPHYFGIPLKMQDIGTSTAPRESTASELQTVPVHKRLPIIPPTTGNPRLLVASTTTPILSSFASQSYHPVVRQAPPLPKYQLAHPTVSRDTLLYSSSIQNSSNYHFRELNDAYSSVALYSNRIPYMASNKSRSPSSVIGHEIVNNARISHGIIPYSRDHKMNQSKANMNQSKQSTDLPQKSSSPEARDGTCSDGQFDVNGNVKQTGKPCLSEKPLKIKQTGMASSDSTINKLLSQIEEARIEEMKAKQKDLQDTDSNSSQEGGLEISIWKCGQCDKSFAQQQILQLHICPSVPEKPYKCTYCAESFAQPSDLRTHAVCHSGKKPFKCGFCSRLFAGSTTLNNHIRTHTGERPFGCEKCGKEFSQASQLSRHRRALYECS